MAWATAWMRMRCGRHGSSCTRSWCFELFTVLRALRVLSDIIEKAKDLGRIPFGACPVFDPEQHHEAAIKDICFVEKLRAFFRSQRKERRSQGPHPAIDSRLVKIQNRFHPVDPATVRPTIHL